MNQENLEVVKKLMRFAKGKLVSAYNSELFQNFKAEYTGAKLVEKLRAGKVGFVNGVNQARVVFRPRYKLAKARAIAAGQRFLSFTKENLQAAKNSDLYKDFQNSKLVQNCRKYGRKAVLAASISGVLLGGGYIFKKSYKDKHEFFTQTVDETIKQNENLLFATIVHSENFSNEPYRDSAGVPTIGYGTTVYPNGKRVTMGDKAISRTLSPELIEKNNGNYKDAMYDKAQGYVISHLEKEVYPALKQIKNFNKLTQNQQVALGLFVYNIGKSGFEKSSVLQELNAGNTAAAFDNILKYNKVKDKQGNLVFAKGLQKRRTYEYMIAKDNISLSDVMKMPIGSLYVDSAYEIMYGGKTAKDFAGENIVKPDSSKTAGYVTALTQASGNTVEHCVNSACRRDIKATTRSDIKKIDIAMIEHDINR